MRSSNHVLADMQLSAWQRQEAEQQQEGAYKFYMRLMKLPIAESCKASIADEFKFYFNERVPTNPQTYRDLEEAI